MEIMKTYYIGGTLGDSYITLCKLYSIAIKEPIFCKHCRMPQKLELQPAIREIYGLLPNIKVEFLDENPPGLVVHGRFQHKGDEEEKRIYNLEPIYYPEFSLPDISHLGLPDNYIVIQPISGVRKNRRLRLEEINEIVKNSSSISVFVEKDKYELNVPNVLNFSGQTSIKEDMSIIRGGQHFYGPQGLLSYVALSLKVPSTIYLSTGWELDHFYGCAEVIEEWSKFLTKKKI